MHFCSDAEVGQDRASGFDSTHCPRRGTTRARNRTLAANIEKGEVWVKVGVNKWQCRNCGAIVESAEAPEKCPVCDHPKAYFQLEQNNF